MINIKIHFFGMTSDLVHKTELSIPLKENAIVKDFKIALVEQFPTLKNMDSYAIAVNESYATDEVFLKNGDVVAIIPPVSGG